jgi:hypothetical protein
MFTPWKTKLELIISPCLTAIIRHISINCDLTKVVHILIYKTMMGLKGEKK